MNSLDLLMKWSTISLGEIEEEILAGDETGAIEQLYGPAEVAEMRGLAAAPVAENGREAVVLLPGVMGSLLHSIRGKTELLWINPMLFLKGQAGLLGLHEDGTRDAHPEIDAVPIGAERLVYLKICLAIRRRAELFEFPYDWRRPIEYNGDVLHEYIERWADGDSEKRFSLVAHSMGGLVARAYLRAHPRQAERRIKRLIMLGTPHFGVAGAVENVVLGNDMLALVRNMPSVYELLPAPPDLYPGARPYPTNWDLYDAAEWRIEGIRQDLLDNAHRFHGWLATADPQVEMVEIAGCHMETTVEIRRSFGPDERPAFEAIRVESGPDSGDSTVPLWSTRLPGAKMYFTQNLHRYLPKRKGLIDDVLTLVQGGEPDLPTEIPEPRSGLFAEGKAVPVEERAERLREGLQSGSLRESDLAALAEGF